MKCPECMGETFEDGLFDMADIFKGSPVVFKNVPAARCTQCGFTLVSATVSKQIGRALAEGSNVRTGATLFDLAAQVVDMSEIPDDQRTPEVEASEPVGTVGYAG